MRQIGGRVALVTGASRGIGCHIAAALFDHGLKVVITARSEAELIQVGKAMDPSGTRVRVVSGDVTDELDRKRMLEEARTSFGAVDILVNNAGTDHPQSYELEGTGVGISVVCPGFVRDAGLFHDNTKGETSDVGTVSPEQVARSVVGAITGNRARVIIGPAAMQLTPLVNALSPGLVYTASKMTGAAGAMKRLARLPGGIPGD